MRPRRLTRTQLADHFCLESPATRRLALLLRRRVLRVAPAAAEAVKFRALCYFHADAYFGSIGGNICMIELPRSAKRGLTLSFIHGALLPDPHHLLQGTSKSKRFISIPDAQTAADPRISALIGAAAKLRPWD